jgi:hypothetical protein
MRRRLVFGVTFALVVGGGALWRAQRGDEATASSGCLPDAAATPLYMARAGRACDTCHTDPTGWKNPRLAQRKCNLSCSSCHINPGGGGLRSVSGRFYAQATLPMLLASHRPFEDWDRHLIPAIAERTRANRIGDPAIGTPWGGASELSYDQGRYAGLRANPLLLAGVDFRLGLWLPEGALLVFPMQLDVHLAFHPYRHVTAYASAGVLAKSQGFVETFSVGCRPDDPDASCFSRARSTPFMLKDAFLMLHELPYMSYLRVGRFIPPFGLMYADHTIATRREFELHQGLMHSRVVGAEVGLAPNYPYAQLAVFSANRADRFTDSLSLSPDELPPFFGVGWGAALSFGWRDLGFNAGLSAMIRRRHPRDGGDTESVALSFGFNPWYYVEWLPLTYVGEVALGGRQRSLSLERTTQLAALHELAYLIFNGINLRVRYDYADNDTEIRDDHYHRLTIGADLMVLPSLGFSGFYRARFDAGSAAGASSDGFFYLRAWY